MIPKSELGEKEREFCGFLEKKTGLRFQSRMAPALRLLRKVLNRKQEPHHL